MSACPVRGEDLGRYHQTEVACRRCGGSFCPTHRAPEAHDCETSESGPFGLGEESHRAGGGTTTASRTTGARNWDGTADRTAARRERLAVSSLLLGLYLANIPLSAVGPLAIHYPPTWLIAGTGAVIVLYGVVQGMSRTGHHAWARVRLAVLLASLALAVAGLGAATAYGEKAPGFGPLELAYVLAVGTPLLLADIYRAVSWTLGR